MTEEKYPKFAHRVNPNRNRESLCMVCFRTVGTRKREIDLERDERLHVCENDEDVARQRSNITDRPPLEQL